MQDLVKREELLQFAQSAITGLKISADLGRIDDEASRLKKKLDGRTPLLTSPSTEGHDKVSEETKLETVQVRCVVINCASLPPWFCMMNLSAKTLKLKKELHRFLMLFLLFV
ncbi:hypothetical protein RchiOBHm_Chr7g0221371 [Rosa chinensis]|uniref:Uncharacterized protein n=1 Tax=Rosa chinensis TaxID=74649 RepID=A0A2P6PD07_ROSCH|nr:hypothetical protein RchiOBHm_Chr7g0221371 [Rosa chinensis]